MQGKRASNMSLSKGRRKALGELVWVIDGKTLNPARLADDSLTTMEGAASSSTRTIEIQWTQTGKFQMVSLERVQFQNQEEHGKLPVRRRKPSKQECIVTKEPTAQPIDCNMENCVNDSRTAATTTSKTIEINGEDSKSNRHDCSSNHSASSNDNMDVDDDDQPKPRRRFPQRERTSTTIQIDGQTVLKTNNYVVKGLKYEYGALQEDEKNDSALVARSKRSGKEKSKKRTSRAPAESVAGNKKKKMLPDSDASVVEGDEPDFSSDDDDDEEEAWSEHDDADEKSWTGATEFGTIKSDNQRKLAARKTADVSSASSKNKRKTNKSDWDKRRLDHNEAVKKRTKEKSVLRTQFLANKIKTLEPLIDKSIVTKILAKSKEERVAGGEVQQPKSRPSYQTRQIHVQPDIIEGEMRDYQMLGLQFLVNMYNQNLGTILGDEMGLGKTLQTISFFCYLKETHGVTGPSLVVCPMTVLASWCKELQKWAPSLKFHRVHSSDATEQENQRKILADRGSEFDVILTTYEMVKASQLARAFTRLHFNILALDEGHRIKNHESQIAVAVRKIHCENRLILTGTPLQNNLVELWSLFNFLYGDVFTSSQPFQDAFNINGGRVDETRLKETREVLDMVMIRRLKDQVEKLLPKKIETKVYCPLSKTQLFWYKAILMKDWHALERVNDKEVAGRQQAKTHRNLLENLVMQLRKCCLHPFLFEGAEADIATTTCEELVGASGKLSVLDMLLRSLFKKGHRCVLFSQFTRVLDILEDYCRMRGWKYCRLDGGTARAKRNFLVEQFNADPGPFFIFLMSTRSGGVGLNLQSADTCILYDSDWNPQMDLQAMARVHRIGQKNTVHVYRLVSGGTVEERVIRRAEYKLLLDHSVNPSNASTKSKGLRFEECENSSGLSAKELFADIKFGCHAVFGDSSDNDLPSAEDISFITDRNRTESDSQGRLKGNELQDSSQFHASKQLSGTQEFGGIDFQKVRQERAQKEETKLPENLAGIAHLWRSIKQLEKRKAKKRIVLIDAEGSDYDEKLVPVLAVNKDDVDREAKTRGQSSTKKQNFEHFDYCQVCGDGGLLIICPRCPVALHAECCGVKDPKDFLSCPHHRCSVCNKNNSQAGGMLFACAVCTVAFCEECMPRDQEGIRFLGSCYPFKGLGFDASKLTAYIHCSMECEEYGIAEYGWDPNMLVQEQVCPDPIDVSASFGARRNEVALRAIGSNGQEDLSGRRACAKDKTYVYSDTEDYLPDDEKKLAIDKGGSAEKPTKAVDRVPSDKRKKGSDSSSDSSVSTNEILSVSSEEDEEQKPKARPKTQPSQPSHLPAFSKQRPQTCNGASNRSMNVHLTPSSRSLPVTQPQAALQPTAETTMMVRVPINPPAGQFHTTVQTSFGHMLPVTIAPGSISGSNIPVQVPMPQIQQQLMLIQQQQLQRQQQTYPQIQLMRMQQQQQQQQQHYMQIQQVEQQRKQHQVMNTQQHQFVRAQPQHSQQQGSQFTETSQQLRGPRRLG